MTYTELAARLADLGCPIPVLGLRRIEQRKRRVDVDELAALARALGTSPLALLFPIGHAARVEVLPGQDAETWSAAKWFTAEGPFPDSEAARRAESRQYPNGHYSGGAPLPAFRRVTESTALSFELYRAHDRYLAEWTRHKQHAALALMTTGRGRDRERLRQTQADAAERLALAVEELLADVIRRMREAGVPLPRAHDARLTHLYEGGNE